MKLRFAHFVITVGIFVLMISAFGYYWMLKRGLDKLYLIHPTISLIYGIILIILSINHLNKLRKKDL
jgi:multisubunit Na+/H+ antiporter MnhB subunit